MAKARLEGYVQQAAKRTEVAEYARVIQASRDREREQRQILLAEREGFRVRIAELETQIGSGVGR